jgi:hypothetical protein
MRVQSLGEDANYCCMDSLEPFALRLQFVYCGPGILTVLP